MRVEVKLERTLIIVLELDAKDYKDAVTQALNKAHEVPAEECEVYTSVKQVRLLPNQTDDK